MVAPNTSNYELAVSGDSRLLRNVKVKEEIDKMMKQWKNGQFFSDFRADAAGQQR